ncbi:MAG: hypothetical protein MH825_13700 [Cyanobacteria bacterium]|nr:hypothetical protein [Cyanobacteriota bacterium]
MGKGKRAIATLAIGETYRDRWVRWCAPLWQAYAQRHGYELICFTQPLDGSDRARSRSPAWQKCLILGQPALRDFERVVWIDSDIAIHPNAPDVAASVPMDRVGAVDEFSAPTPAHYRQALEQCHRVWQQQDATIPEVVTAPAYYQQVGLPPQFSQVVQTGMLVLSPRHHRDLLELVYYKYEDAGSPLWNYEMRFLSYELLERDRVAWVDPRFNALWMMYKALHAPALLAYRRGEHRSLFLEHLTAAYRTNYFLHFAGCGMEMAALPHLELG